VSARSGLVVLNGEIPEPALVRAAARRCRGVVCADGGVRHVPALGLRADFVVGDMDSLPRRLPRDARTVYWCDFDEDRSDFEKALGFAADLGCRTIYVAGALGGRVDHVLVNLAVFERYARALDLVLLDRGEARLLGPGRYRLGRGRFSLAAQPRAVVSLSGVRYPARRLELASGSRGLGNAAGARASLTVREGRVWLAR
jgi:thiamine pyrophosphokinase